MQLLGLHHITAIAADPKRNLEFYTRVLGLRFVKKSVNQDDPGTYHLYYGDNTGSPGTALTFFPWLGIRRGRPGAGQAFATGFSAPAGSLAFWQERLARLKIATASVDVACSFKVLAHVPDVRGALSEMARVVRPGGWVLAEFYNARSLRRLVKRVVGARPVSARTDEAAVFTRYDRVARLADYLPPELRWVHTRGVRIVTPAAALHDVPSFRGQLRLSFQPPPTTAIVTSGSATARATAGSRSASEPVSTPRATRASSATSTARSTLTMRRCTVARTGRSANRAARKRSPWRSPLSMSRRTRRSRSVEGTADSPPLSTGRQGHVHASGR